MLYAFDQPINKEKVIKNLRLIFKRHNVEESFIRRLKENQFTDKLILSKILNICVEDEFVLVALQYLDAINNGLFSDVNDYLQELIKEKSIIDMNTGELKDEIIDKEMKNPDNRYLLGNQKYYSSKEIKLITSEIESLFNSCNANNIFVSKPTETYVGFFNNFAITIKQPFDNKHCVETIGCIDSNLSIDELESGKIIKEIERKQYEINDKLYTLIYNK